MITERLHRAPAASTWLIAAALAITACGGGSGSSSETAVTEPAVESSPAATDAPEETTPPATEAPDDDSRCATISRAVDDDGQDEFEPIDCAEPHDAEFAGFAATASVPAGDDDLDFEIELISLCADQVEALTGRPTELYGIDVGPVHDADTGDANNVECWAVMSTPESLTGSLRDTDFDDALGNYSLIVDLDPGSCFRLADEGYDVATIAECTDTDVVQLVVVAASTIEEFDKDAITDSGFAACDAALDDATFEPISSTYSLLSPLEEGWKALDRRTIICLLEPADDGEAEDVVQADATRPCANHVGNDWIPVDCNEPHGGEFAGVITPPFDVLPADTDEASAAIYPLCIPLVEELTGRDLRDPGVGAGFFVSTGPGEPIEDDISCYVATGGSEDALVGSIADIGFDAAFTRLIVADQEPGTCFLLVENFSHGDPADCSEPDALIFVGNITLDDGPFPGADAIRELRQVVCTDLLAASGLPGDPATVSGTFPSQENWDFFGQRNLACDASAL